MSDAKRSTGRTGSGPSSRGCTGAAGEATAAPSSSDPRIVVGSVVQLNEHASDDCYVGCLLIVTELKEWGVQGFIPTPKQLDAPAAQIYLRPKWDAIEWIGTAVMQPMKEIEDE